jgi:3-isopropylmalate/(R)-2-methylmalate dehydratase small subunit
MSIVGKVHKYGDNVDTDVIIPARYLNTAVVEEYSKHCMEDIDADFLKKLNKGDIIVAGKNFGCGSSREHAPISIRAVGVSCVIAKSFARIFYRNSINIGLPILECDEAVDAAENGHKLEVDFRKGVIKNLTLNMEYKSETFPDFVMDIIENEGLVNCVIKGLF